MIGKQKAWDIKEYNKEKAGFLAEELEVSPIVIGILLERGFENADTMREFLFGKEKPFADPFLMKGVRQAVLRIEKAIVDKEIITVYGDYDVDGITASSLMYLYLKGRGAEVNTYIPKRKSEGYGLNDEALRTIYEAGTTLLITVDCGISAVHEVANAPAGMDIIITDHHTVPVELPQAFAIVNTKQSDCQYPFKYFSGVGIAFKLCQAMEQFNGNPEWCEYTELAALGTVADIVPLLGENREIVRRGLKAIAHTKLVGLQALLQCSDSDPEKVTSDIIGFRLAPRLNAVGRLEHAQSAVELLVTDDPEKAAIISEELNRENKLRQEIGRQIQAEAERMLAQEEHIDTAIVLAKEGWHQGVIGIVASKLVDKYHLPTILISIDGENAKGSCRSIPALNLYEAIDSQHDLLLQFGGHHQAAGLTLKAANVEAFREGFKAYVRKKLKPEDFIPKLTIDSVLCPHQELTLEDIDNLSLLEPFGCENSAPIFAFSNAVLSNQRAIGNDHNHLQFTAKKGNFEYKAIMWNRADLMPILFENMLADIAFKPCRNEWNEHVSVQLQTEAIRQKLIVLDGRHHNGTKLQFLKKLTRTANNICLLTNDELQPELKDWILENNDMVRVASYKEMQLSLAVNTTSVVVALGMPDRNVFQVVNACREQQIEQLVLLYDDDDWQKYVRKLGELCPDRIFMAREYSELMGKLRSTGTVLVNQAGISETAMIVFQELEFIRVNKGFITPCEKIKETRLENSPYYAKLLKVKNDLIRLYNDNMRLSQFDLLRTNVK